jgi:hypothetical protein
MHFSALDKFFWAAGFFLNAGFLCVLLWRRRWPQFPTLTVWIAFQVARTAALFLIYLHGSKYWYVRVYLTGVWVDFFLQLGIAAEIARIVLRPTGTWLRDARTRFVAAGLAGAALAAVLAWWVTPPASTVRILWQIRANLFTSLVICELFVAMSLTANRLGLGWRHHVMAVGQGLTTWTTVMVLSAALQSFLGVHHYFVGLDYIRFLAYVTAIIWMTIQLWIPEPQRQPISSDLQEYILALHKRVEYDLRRLDARH